MLSNFNHIQLLAQLGFIAQNSINDFGSREKHDTDKSHTKKKKKKKKNEKMSTWTRLARMDMSGNNQVLIENAGGGKRNFSQVGDHSELPCKKKQVLR